MSPVCASAVGSYYAMNTCYNVVYDAMVYGVVMLCVYLLWSGLFISANKNPFLWVFRAILSTVY